MSDKIKSREELEKAFKRISDSIQVKKAHLELSSDARAEELCDFIGEHFIPDETLCNFFGVSYNECIKRNLREFLHDNLSVLLIDDSTGKIIACQSLAIDTKGGPNFAFEDEKFAKTMECCQIRFSEADIYQRFAVDTVVNVAFLGVHKERRRKGLATTVFQAALMFAKEFGLNPTCARGEGSAYGSQRLFEKCGFKTVGILKYDEYKIDGKVVFENITDIDSLKFYQIKL